MGFGSTYSVYTGYVGQLSVQGQSEVILCTSEFRQPCISKLLAVEQSGPKFEPRGEGEAIQRVHGTFDSYMFKVSLRSFGGIPIVGNLIAEMDVVRQKGPKFGPGGKYTGYLGYISQLSSRSV